MMPTIMIELDDLKFVPERTNQVETALVRALNKTADRFRTRAAEMARSQVAFPASYLSPANKRLWVATRARKKSFEAIIEGRGQATSLARFTRAKPLEGGSRHRGGSVTVMVKPGVSRVIRRAFIMKLNNDNLGLAVRTEGGKPRGAYKPKEIGRNLWLLYGPSVDQALIAASDGEGIYQDMIPEALDFLEFEFNRQMDLLDA